MRIGKAPAIVGGAVGLLGAAAAAGLAQQRRTVGQARALIDPESAAAFGSLPVDRDSVVHTDDGVVLHIEESGPLAAGVTVLYVHGFTLNLASFHFQRLAVTAQFGARVRQVFFDQRSHGRSEHSPAQACTIEQLGRDLYSVIDQFVPAGDIVLVGHSMGGMTLMALASQHPELFVAGGRVRSAVLINTSSGDLRNITLGMPSVLARLHGPVLPLVLRGAARRVALVERGRELGKDLAWLVTRRLSFADRDVAPEIVDFCNEMIAGTPVDVVAEFLMTLREHDGRLGLRNLTECPVLVIGADSDALTPASHSERIAAALPHARLLMVPNSGHLLMLEHPEVVNRELISVIEDVLTSGRGASKPAVRAR